MKTSRLILLFLFLAIVRHVRPLVYDDGGLNFTLTDTNDDPNSCIVNLTYVNHATEITFSVEIVNNSGSDCTHHDLQFWSIFRGDSLNGNIQLAPTADPNIASGNLTLADIKKYNGTACMYGGGFDANEDFWFCQFRYNNIYFFVSFGKLIANGQFDPEWSGQLFPIAGEIITGEKNGYTIWKPNSTYPHIVGTLSTDCGNQWNNRISDLNTEAWLTGTDQASKNIDLYPYLQGLELYNIYVRPNNANESTELPYDAYVPNATLAIFGNETNSSCSDTGLKYAAFVNNLDRCKDGCAVSVSLVKNDKTVFILQTTGLTTIPARIRRT